jgi:hypothetical protein
MPQRSAANDILDRSLQNAAVRFPIDNTWNWEARASAFYGLPWGFQISGLFRA